MKKRLENIDHPDCIMVKVEGNPKKPGTAAHERFKIYRDGMLIEEARALGVTARDIRYDLSHGFITTMSIQFPEHFR